MKRFNISFPSTAVYGLVVLFIALSSACSKLDGTSADKVASEANSSNLIDTSLANLTFVSNPTNLNVIMFVPSDNPAEINYKTRLSQLLVYFQQWLHTEMTRYGYDSYLGLSLQDSNGLVNIIEVPAAGGQADYPYEVSSATKIINEIAAYRASHPEQFSSNFHYLILLPQRTDGNSSQPFYGYGKYCFAVDNASMSVNHIPNPSSNYLGGMLHELGHGINLAHNHAKYLSEEPTLGTSLMGSGNYSFSQGEPTFLTGVDATILSQNEVFQSIKPAQTAYQSPTYNLSPRFSIDNENGKLRISGSYTSNLPVTDFLVYMDPNVNNEGSAGDYNAVAWHFPVTAANVLDGTIDLNELYYKGNTPYDVRIKLVLDNGALTSNSYVFAYQNDLLTTSQDSIYTYINASYTGAKAAFGIGEYRTADLISRGMTDNNISSVQVGTEVTATLYNNDNFTGDSIVLTSSSSYLSTFNDRASSIRVRAK